MCTTAPCCVYQSKLLQTQAHRNSELVKEGQQALALKWQVNTVKGDPNLTLLHDACSSKKEDASEQILELNAKAFILVEGPKQWRRRKVSHPTGYPIMARDRPVPLPAIAARSCFGLDTQEILESRSGLFHWRLTRLCTAPHSFCSQAHKR